MTTDYNEGLEDIQSENDDLESTPIAYEVITYSQKNIKLNPQFFYWKWPRLRQIYFYSTGSFNILGGNCSTHASSAFVAANVVSSGIHGLDTPNNLYKQLKVKHSGKSRIYSGFAGVIPLAGDKYDLVIE